MLLSSTRRCLLLSGGLRRCTIPSRRFLSAASNVATNTGGSSGPSSPSALIVKKPPNIKFDKRSKSSPFFGLEPINKETPKDDDAVEPTPAALPTLSREEFENYPEGDVADEDDCDDDVELWFDLSQKPNPRLIPIIPLPERLHVNVLDKNDATLVGTIYLDSIVFGQPSIRVDLIHRVVQYQRAKKRGKRKHLVKTVGTTSGSGRKVRPQKGGGQARAGHSRPPHWRGGGRAHGPRGSVQDYTQSLNKKIRKLGMVHALSQKLLEQNVIVVNDLFMDSHKTKDLGEMLSTHFKVAGRSGATAIICDHVEEDSDEVFRHLPVKMTVAAGNIEKVKVLHPHYLNVYDLLKYEKLVLTVGAIEELERRFKNAAY